METCEINREQEVKQIAESWNTASDAYYSAEYGGTAVLDLLRATPETAFPSAVFRNIHACYPSLEGVRICVPSSGDNLAVFAFHLLGARVTSCDISSEQLKNARAIADAQGWDITFRQTDTMRLDGISDGAYDLVYTSNGVHVWIGDLPSMYASIFRILREGGRYLFFETHPFIRPFDDSTSELRIRKRYDDTGPFDTPANYLWRICDFANALTGAGFSICGMDELYSEKNALGCTWWGADEWDEKSDWHRNPYAALPQWLAFSCAKPEK